MSASWWGLGGAAIAIWCEYLYRSLTGSWWSYLWAWIPLQVCVGYCVYKLVTAPGTSLLDAFVVWTFSTIALRIFVSMFLLHDTVAPGTWAALGFILCARIAQVTWK